MTEVNDASQPGKAGDSQQVNNERPRTDFSIDPRERQFSLRSTWVGITVISIACALVYHFGMLAISVTGVLLLVYRAGRFALAGALIGFAVSMGFLYSDSGPEFEIDSGTLRESLGWAFIGASIGFGVVESQRSIET